LVGPSCIIDRWTFGPSCMRVGPARCPRLDHVDPYKLTCDYMCPILIPTLSVAMHGHIRLVFFQKEQRLFRVNIMLYC
jgi:hypothetical protein